MRLNEFADQVSAALGGRLVSLLLYGSAARKQGADGGEQEGLNTLLVVDAVDPDLFKQLGASVKGWSAKHPPPLILTEEEWRDSTDAFPIEYDDIKEAHRVLAGKDPWHGVRVQRADVRRQLEHELKGKLVHVRQAYAAAWDQPRRLADVVAGTRAGFLTMLRAVLRLAGRPVPASADDLAREAGGLIGFSAERMTEPAGYLEAMTKTAQFVNRLERNPL